MLYLCNVLVYWMWSRGTDPDNAAIPYLTAVHCSSLYSSPRLDTFQIGDLIGTSLLAVAFIALESIGDTSLENLEESHHHNLAHNVSVAINQTLSHFEAELDSLL